MPVKFAPSVLKVDRANNKRWYEHSYMKSQSIQTLMEAMEKATPKRRQKNCQRTCKERKTCQK